MTRLIQETDTFISGSYVDILDAANKGNLVPLQYYRIRDYETRHIIPHSYSPNFDGNGLVDNKVAGKVNVGPVEPLIIQATDRFNFAPRAYSEAYPDDIIYYSLTAEGVLADQYIPLEGTKGFIYRRIDPVLRIDTPEDWRAVRFRRFQIGDNPFGLNPNEYFCITSVDSIGSDEQFDQGTKNIYASTSNFIDVLPFLNKRDLKSADNIFSVYIGQPRNPGMNGEYRGPHHLTNIVRRAAIPIDPPDSVSPEEIHTGLVNVSINQEHSGDVTILGSELKNAHFNRFYTNYIAPLNYMDLDGSGGSVKQTVLTGFTFNTSLNGLVMSKSEILSFLANNDQSDSSFYGITNNLIIRMLDDDGNVANKDYYGQNFYSNVFHDVSDLAINKAVDMKHCFFRGTPESLDENTGFNLQLDETPRGLVIDPVTNVSNLSEAAEIDQSSRIVNSAAVLRNAGTLKLRNAPAQPLTGFVYKIPDGKVFQLRNDTGSDSIEIAIDPQSSTAPYPFDASSVIAATVVANAKVAFKDYALIRSINGTLTVVEIK